GYWADECYISLINAARLMQQLGNPYDDVITTYNRAEEFCPHRAEALHGAARFCRIAGKNKQGYDIARRGLSLSVPDGLFVERWIYDYGLKDEFAINAYWAGHYTESLQASLDLLSSTSIDGGTRERISANARFAATKIAENP